MKKILTLILFLVVVNAFTQQIYIDKGVNLNGLWCFPMHNNDSTYLYLPKQARLAVDENKHPKFSFLRYITENPTATETANSITEAGGGGIVNFLILYDTPKELIEDAEKLLIKKFDNKSLRIRGPVVFESGKYALVSSILNKETGSNEQKLLAKGKAPVLENSSIPLTFEVNAKDSKLLLESLKMDTPDISLLFDLSFSGLSESYDATLEINWSEIKSSKSFGAGGTVYFVGADVEYGIDELFKNNTIKLTTNGSDAALESLLTTVYDKLLDLMFKPVEPTVLPDDQQGGMMDAITSLIGSDGPLSSGKTTGFGLNVSFALKELRTEGTSNLQFKGRSTVNRHHFITFNIGDLYKKYGDDKGVFKDVPLWDPAFQQREVIVGIDGDIEKEFNAMLNFVSVTIRKKHKNGHETIADILISKETIKELGNTMSMTYLNQDDNNQSEWLEYEYKTSWKFKGGGSYDSNWMSEHAAMINLFTPFQRRKIYLDGNLEMLKNKGVKAISVAIEYPFFDQIKKDRLTIRPSDNLSDKFFEITLPNNSEEVTYSITWMKTDRTVEVMKGVDKFGLIFIDELKED
jgi:hypothetical protein